MTIEPAVAAAPRHPWCDEFCSYLERAIRIEDLRAIAASVEVDTGALVLLPSFAWMAPAINVGRKTHNPEGQNFTLPVRLTYDTGPVVILSERQTVTVGLRARGLGHDFTSEITVVSRPHWGHSDEIRFDSRGVPTRVEVSSVANLRRCVRYALSDAEQARWEAAASFLRPQMEREADRSISLLRSSSSVGGAVPEAVRDRVIDRIAFGITDKNDSREPPLLRLVDKCCQPEAFVNADPAKIAAMTLRRDAMNAAQSETGDTRLGVKLRNLAETMGADVTPAQLAAEANRLKMSSTKITEAKARIALDYVLPVNVALPRQLTWDVNE